MQFLYGKAPLSQRAAYSSAPSPSRAFLRYAAELTKRKITTPRGGRWSAQTVKMVVGRLAS
jgi:hypothetical protein